MGIFFLHDVSGFSGVYFFKDVSCICDK